jgi:hypothetical protein
MKKLGKITINPEKVIKNEELLNLKGGYEGLATVYCFDGEEYLGCVQTPYCPTDPLRLCSCATWAHCIEGGPCM